MYGSFMHQVRTAALQLLALDEVADSGSSICEAGLRECGELTQMNPNKQEKKKTNNKLGEIHLCTQTTEHKSTKWN